MALTITPWGHLPPDKPKWNLKMILQIIENNEILQINEILVLTNP